MDSYTSTGSTNYDSLKGDSELLVKFINKYVKVVTIKKCTFKGFVHSIDPVTHSIILLIPDQNRYTGTIIPGHAVLEVTQEELSENLIPPKSRPSQVELSPDLLKRKTKLMSWFESNLLPVSELDSKIIIGDAYLLPPYSVLDLFTENSIVASEIKKIMERMPED